MVEIVNLRRARKARKRRDQEKLAGEHRALYGRTKAERRRESAERDRGARVLDDHRRDLPPEQD